MQPAVHRTLTLLLLAGSAAGKAAAAQAVSAPGGPPIRYTIPNTVIAAALSAEGLDASADHLHLAAPLTAATASPRLRIASAEARPDGTLQLRLLCRSSVECLPFFVTITSAPDSAGLLGKLALRQASSRAATSSLEHPSGIAVGAHITLLLTDPQMHLRFPALAIDAGTPGTEIRVSSLDRKQTWRATVVDATTVQGGLQ